MKISKSIIGLTLFSILLYLGLSFFINPMNNVLYYAINIFLVIILGISTISIIDQKFSEYKVRKNNINKKIDENTNMTKNNLLMNERYHKIDSENKRLVKQALMFDELFYESLDLSNQIIFVKDMAGKFKYINQTFLDLYNLEKESIIDKTDKVFLRYKRFASVVEKDLRDDELLKSDQKESVERDSIIPREHGHDVIIHTHKSLFTYNNEHFILGVSSDITENEHNEEKYKEEIKKYEKKLDKKNKLLDSIRQLTRLFYSAEVATVDEFEKLLINIFDFSMNLIEEADYGSIYIFEDEKVKYLKSYGFNIHELNALEIPEEDFSELLSKQSLVIKNTEASLQFIDEAGNHTNRIKESIRIALKNKNKIIGSMSFDIDSVNDKVFEDYSIFLMNSLSKLINIIITLVKSDTSEKHYEQNMIKALLNMLEIHDEYTNDHSETVANLSKELGLKLELPMIDIDRLYWAGITHDIGKIEISADILNKKEKLTTEEFRRIKHHPVIGYKALTKLDSLNDIAKYVLHHHERIDGLGYPDGLSGTEIPLISRILSVVDAWDAMTSERSYRDSLPYKVAVDQLLKNKGSQFDEFIVNEFIELLREKDIITEELYESLEVKL
jgi:PAS domain S-box-containing protein